METLLTVSQTAALLGVSVDILHARHESGDLIPAKVTAGNHRRYTLSQVLCHAGFELVSTQAPQPQEAPQEKPEAPARAKGQVREPQARRRWKSKMLNKGRR